MTNEGLYASDFEAYFKKLEWLQPLFECVTSIDKLPKTLPLRHFVIVNLSPSGTEGSHWTLLVRSHKKCIEIFNSLGSDNVDNFMPHFKFRFAAEVEYNNTQVQKSTTSTCGLFCVYFIIHRALNFDQSLNELMTEIFSLDLEENENKVTKFCNHLLENSGDESLLFDL